MKKAKNEEWVQFRREMEKEAIAPRDWKSAIIVPIH